MNDLTEGTEASWWTQHEFLLRRLHSLSGLVPIGAFMVTHLLVNASLLNSAATFQTNVYRIHALGRMLWLVEWLFIFLPLMFHGILGLIIIRSGVSNVSGYPYSSNLRYTLQRISGIIAFLFIGWHVFHMHGWIHIESWMRMARNLQGSQFRPMNAASSVVYAMQSWWIVALYAIGILACVYHLANGIWTMGITWGIWTSPAGQRRANWIAGGFGLAVAVVGIAALVGTQVVSLEEALQSEKRMEAQLAEDRILWEETELPWEPPEHKSWTPEELEQRWAEAQQSK